MPRKLTRDEQFIARQHLRFVLPGSYGESNWDATAWALIVFQDTSLCLTRGALVDLDSLEETVSDWFAGRGPDSIESEFSGPDPILERVSYGVN